MAAARVGLDRCGLEILAAELAASIVSDDDVLALRTYLSQM
ncbi:hypothetical protein [Arthrobacter pigmenti]